MSDATINHGGNCSHVHPTDITNDDRQLLAGVRGRFKRLTEAPGTKVFTTYADGSELWRVFVSNLPAYLRQLYACNTCRRFVEQYGGLVVINPDDGQTSSLFWGSVTGDSPFALSINSMARLVNRAHISGVFLSPLEWWGTPVTGPWEHFAVQTPSHMHYTHPLLTADQMMAERRQYFEMLSRSLNEYNIDVAANVRDLLATGDTLYRSEKVLGVAEWFHALHTARKSTRNAKVREQRTWLAVATAPAGYCHVRSSMIGTLLDDVAAGMNVKAVMARFAEKMNPLQYRRTTALPTTQGVKAATEAVDKLRAAGALERRFLRPDEVVPMWRSTVAKDAPANTGVFKNVALAAGVERRGYTRVEAPRQNITWVKFRDTVLPNALLIEVYTPHDDLPFIALTTAVHADAPPVLQWDSEGYRNPVSWYVLSNGAIPRQFNLTGDKWHEVSGVCALPPQWTPNAQDHWGDGAVFVINGCRHTGAGTGMFTEQMRSEWHPHRRVLEEYMRDAKVEGGDGPCAAGIDVRKGSSSLVYGGRWLVRVTTATATTQYKIDRWD